VALPSLTGRDRRAPAKPTPDLGGPALERGETAEFVMVRSEPRDQHRDLGPQRGVQVGPRLAGARLSLLLERRRFVPQPRR
jgi:hypothetical protein